MIPISSFSSYLPKFPLQIAKTIAPYTIGFIISDRTNRHPQNHHSYTWIQWSWTAAPVLAAALFSYVTKAKMLGKALLLTCCLALKFFIDYANQKVRPTTTQRSEPLHSTSSERPLLVAQLSPAHHQSQLNYKSIQNHLQHFVGNIHSSNIHHHLAIVRKEIDLGNRPVDKLKNLSLYLREDITSNHSVPRRDAAVWLQEITFLQTKIGDAEESTRTAQALQTCYSLLGMRYLLTRIEIDNNPKNLPKSNLNNQTPQMFKNLERIHSYSAHTFHLLDQAITHAYLLIQGNETDQAQKLLHEALNKIDQAVKLKEVNDWKFARCISVIQSEIAIATALIDLEKAVHVAGMIYHLETRHSILVDILKNAIKQNASEKMVAIFKAAEQAGWQSRKNLPQAVTFISLLKCVTLSTTAKIKLKNRALSLLKTLLIKDCEFLANHFSFVVHLLTQLSGRKEAEQLLTQLPKHDVINKSRYFLTLAETKWHDGDNNQAIRDCKQAYSLLEPLKNNRNPNHTTLQLAFCHLAKVEIMIRGFSYIAKPINWMSCNQHKVTALLFISDHIENSHRALITIETIAKKIPLFPLSIKPIITGYLQQYSILADRSFR